MRALACLVSWIVAAAIAGCGGGGTVTPDAGRMDGGRALDGGGLDAGRMDDGGARDAGRMDDASPADAGPPVDVGPLCEGMMRGACTAAGVGCECCPAGGPLGRCLCTSRCSSDTDCTDPARPHCNRPMVGVPGGGGAPPGICTATMFICAWGAMCASPDTPIATPRGDRQIAELSPGDLVYSLDHGVLREVAIDRVTRTPVVGHRVVRITLASGAVIEMSEGHPTADGRTFGALDAGDLMDGVPIRSIELVPYLHDATYDILPRSDTGTYVAAGVLVGSTLAVPLH